MRPLKEIANNPRVRVQHPGEDGFAGFFHARSKSWLRVICSNGGGWDHVSVSTMTRVPTYDEMMEVARVFFKADETAMQLMVPEANHVNNHPYCLHWWRPHDTPIPLPPIEYV